MKKSFMTTAGALAFALILSAHALAAATTAGEEINVRGRLRPGVEANCWMIMTAGGEKYHLLNASRFRNESWFKGGTEVEGAGEIKKGVMTTCMEGTPFEARTLGPAGGDSSGGGGATMTTAGGPERRLTRVSVTGESVVQAQPDTAVVSVAVVTQNASASEAQAENAGRSEAVVRAVKAAAGAGAEVKTGGYSLQPQFEYRQNEAPKITSYVARNSVVVTTGELARVGAVIDAASRAGANNVDGLQFTLRQDRPARQQAVTGATLDALSKARDIASALGGRVVRVVEVQEAGAYRPPVPLEYARTTMAQADSGPPQTPILAGSLDVRASVQLVAEVETQL